MQSAQLYYILVHDIDIFAYIDSYPVICKCMRVCSEWRDILQKYKPTLKLRGDYLCNLEDMSISCGEGRYKYEANIPSLQHVCAVGACGNIYVSINHGHMSGRQNIRYKYDMRSLHDSIKVEFMNITLDLQNIADMKYPLAHPRSDELSIIIFLIHNIRRSAGNKLRYSDLRRRLPIVNINIPKLLRIIFETEGKGNGFMLLNVRIINN